MQLSYDVFVHYNFSLKEDGGRAGLLDSPLDLLLIANKYQNFD